MSINVRPKKLNKNNNLESRSKFKKYTQIFFIFLLIFSSFSVSAIEIKELIQHIDSLWRGDTSHASMSMTVKTQRYQRSMSMEAWSKGKDYSLVVIRQSIKDKGIATHCFSG
ncbi:MAG: hypothetical protein QM484_09965 [Woeseiaceae bacterium]